MSRCWPAIAAGWRIAGARLNECPLGAAALAGTSFPIDRQMTAAALGFDRPAANSLDAVSDRDFALEFLAAAAICAMHLSRFAEEIVIWSSAPFGFIRLSDAFTTGSSIMPQKRNPDAAELVRAKTGRVTGALVGLLTVMKGLPLAYAKDMQEDKEPVFDAAEAWALSLAAMAGMVRDMTPDLARMRAFAGAGFATATDLADWLVRVLRLPFRDAHHVTGALVARAEARGVDWPSCRWRRCRRWSRGSRRRCFRVLTVDASVASRTSYGGTAGENVAREAARWLARAGRACGMRRGAGCWRCCGAGCWLVCWLRDGAGGVRQEGPARRRPGRRTRSPGRGRIRRTDFLCPSDFSGGRGSAQRRLGDGGQHEHGNRETDQGHCVGIRAVQRSASV